MCLDVYVQQAEEVGDIRGTNTNHVCIYNVNIIYVYVILYVCVYIYNLLLYFSFYLFYILCWFSLIETC